MLAEVHCTGKTVTFHKEQWSSEEPVSCLKKPKPTQRRQADISPEH